MAETTTRKPRSLALVLLAAGKGKRLKSETPKVLHPICGRPELWHVMQAGLAAKPTKVIVVVGHIVVPAALWIETNYSPPVWLQLAIYLPLTFIMSLLLLQPVKGTVVGLQWALRMHGFDENAPSDIPPV